MTELLGRRVRCKVTGFDGVADQYVELLGGTIQYSIQPRGNGTAIPEAYCFDIQQVERTPGSSADDPVESTKPPVVDIALGDKVEDIVTGTVGIVTRKATFLNGCVYFTVTEHRDAAARKDGEPSSLFAQHDRLVVIERDAIGKLRAARMPAKPAPAPDAPKTGGPMTRSQRI